MSYLAVRMKDFLSEEEVADIASNERQIKAIETLIQGVENRTIRVTTTTAEFDALIAKLKTVRSRLQEIDGKLKLAVKSGIVSTSVH